MRYYKDQTYPIGPDFRLDDRIWLKKNLTRNKPI